MLVHVLILSGFLMLACKSDFVPFFLKTRKSKSTVIFVSINSSIFSCRLKQKKKEKEGGQEWMDVMNTFCLQLQIDWVCHMKKLKILF